VIYQRVEPPVSPAQHFADRQPSRQDLSATASNQAEGLMAEQTYLRLQRLVFAFGVDALPNPRAAASSREHGPLVNAVPKILSRNDWLRMQSP
jgi:hypothetical protein